LSIAGASPARDQVVYAGAQPNAHGRVNIKSVAERKLAQLDAAPSVSFMKAPPGNDLKEYDGAWHVRINDQWRLTFKWGESGPYDVLIEDPH
jgi:toxin HigB-1